MVHSDEYKLRNAFVLSLIRSTLKPSTAGHDVHLMRPKQIVRQCDNKWAYDVWEKLKGHYAARSTRFSSAALRPLFLSVVISYVLYLHFAQALRISSCIVAPFSLASSCAVACVFSTLPSTFLNPE